MWIRTQNKQRIINSDQIVDIFISKTGTTIFAETTISALDKNLMVLGEYANRDICLTVVESLSTVISSDTPVVTMPLGGELDNWYKNIAEIATANIVKKFKVW